MAPPPSSSSSQESKKEQQSDDLSAATTYAFVIIILISVASFIVSTFVLDLSHYHHQHTSHGASFHATPMSPDSVPAPTFSGLDVVQGKQLPQRRINLKRAPRTAGHAMFPWVETDDKTIFLAIASYRDEECKVTVENMFMRANNPRRLFLGIFEQNDNVDPICVPDGWQDCDSADFCPIDNLRRRMVPSSEGKGPCYARYIAMLMFRHENYYFIIDSHMVWTRHWDTKSLAHFNRARSTRPVMTHYPNAWDKNASHHESSGRVMVMCNGEFNSSLHYIKMKACWFDRKADPFPQPFAAGGFLYGDSQLIYEVPMDPYLVHLFDGEEIMYSVRTWVNGFDLFSPGENVVYHNYKRQSVVRWWDKNRTKWHGHALPAQRRVQYFLEANVAPGSSNMLVDANAVKAMPNVTAKEEIYGIKNRVRSFEDFQQYAMIDLKANRVEMDFCWNITRKKYHL
jgi:hypothetical protein